MVYTEQQTLSYMAFWLASAVASGGSGYQYQALFYMLLVVFGGFNENHDKWLGLSVFFLAAVLVSGALRAGVRGR